MKEVNINIEGYNVNGICVGCLNYNRRMFYHYDVKECFRLLANIDVPDGLEVQVCWECLAHVKSAVKFKERILKSYDFLISYSKQHTFLDSPNDFAPHASTNIERTDVECYECLPEPAEDETDKDVKNEKETAEKLEFELTIKEETFEDPYFEDAPIIDNDVTSDEDVQLSKLKEIETEKVKKKREKEKDRMPTNKRPRKTTRGLTDVSQFEAAYAEIIKGTSIRQAAKMFGINYITLQRYKTRRVNSNAPVTVGYCSNSYFSSDQENIITKYLEEYAGIYPGLCAKVVRKFASEYGQKHGVKIVDSWVTNGMAGTDWYKNFLYRNNEIENHMKRLSSKEKVRVFYDRLWNIFVQYNFCPENIYAIAEIGVNIEEFRDKIWLITTKNSPIALKESQVRFTYAANASGFAVPPLFIISQKKDANSKTTQTEIKKENIPKETTFSNFLQNGVDLKNLPDWTEDTNFLIFLKHFKKNLKCELGPKLLLMIENQTFHLSIECMEYCRENDIILLVIPSYLSQNIEPLAPITFHLKKAIASLYNTLVLEKPQQKKSVYNIPSMVFKALLGCLKPSCIQDGFKDAGIFPYNREVIVNGLEDNNTD